MSYKCRRDDFFVWWQVLRNLPLLFVLGALKSMPTVHWTTPQYSCPLSMLQTTLVNSLLLPVVEYEINTTSESTWWDALLGMDREMKAHVNFQFKWDVSIVLNFDSTLTIQYIIRAKPDAEKCSLHTFKNCSSVGANRFVEYFYIWLFRWNKENVTFLRLLETTATLLGLWIALDTEFWFHFYYQSFWEKVIMTTECYLPTDG